MRWRAVSAKLLARRGRLPAARKPADEGLALIPAAGWPTHRADLLIAKAEVLRLADASGEAAHCLREALDIYTELHDVPRAERTQSALASLGAQPG